MMKVAKVNHVTHFVLFNILFSGIIPYFIYKYTPGNYWILIYLANIDIVANIFTNVTRPQYNMRLYMEFPNDIESTVYKTFFNWMSLIFTVILIFDFYYLHGYSRAIKITIIATLFTYLLPPFFVPELDKYLSRHIDKGSNSNILLHLIIHLSILIAFTLLVFKSESAISHRL